MLPIAFGLTLSAITTGLNLAVQLLPGCVVSLLPRKNGPNAVVVQTQSL